MLLLSVQFLLRLDKLWSNLQSYKQILNSIDNPETKLMYFTRINNSRFKKTVIPGDQIHFEVSLDKFRLGTCKIIGTAKVDDKIVAEAEMMASVVDRRN